MLHAWGYEMAIRFKAGCLLRDPETKQLAADKRRGTITLDLLVQGHVLCVFYLISALG